MDAVSSPSRITLPLAPAGAGVLALIAGLAVLGAPTALLEAFAVDSGIAAIVAAAEPPLGITARLAMTLAATGGVFAAAWVLLDLLGPGRALVFNLPAALLSDGVREPVRATRDLGVPFLEVTAGRLRPAKSLPADVERPLPTNLDLPLSIFDPGALPSVPADPVPLVPALAKAKPEPQPDAFELTVRAPEPPLAVPMDDVPVEPAPAADRPAQPAPAPVAAEPALAPAERWEVVELPTPPVTRTAERTERPTEATIQALLARLERGMAQKPAASAAEPAPAPVEAAAPAAPWPSLSDTLGELRALAAGRG